MALDRLTPPFRIKPHDAAFQVVDANGATVCWVHYDERDLIGTGFGDRLTRKGALRVATWIRRLPELVK